MYKRCILLLFTFASFFVLAGCGGGGGGSPIFSPPAPTPYNPLDDQIYGDWYTDIHNAIPGLGLSGTHVENNSSLVGNVTWNGGFVGNSELISGDPVTGTTRIIINLDRVRDDDFRFSPHGQIAVTDLRKYTSGSGWDTWNTGQLPVYNIRVSRDGTIRDASVSSVIVDGNFYGTNHQAIQGELSVFDDGPYDGLDGNFSGRR